MKRLKQFENWFNKKFGWFFTNGNKQQLPLVLQKGIEVFGTMEKFDEWMCKPNYMCGGKMPRSLTQEEVMNHLTAIEHGDNA